jgi:DNA primase
VQELDELIDRLDMASYLDYSGIEYRNTVGRSGPQLWLKECPSCGGSKWKVYIGEETGLGSCFHGGCELERFNKWAFVKAVLGASSNKDVFNHLKQVSIHLGWRPKRQAKATALETPEVKLPESVELPDVNGDVPEYLARRGVTPELCSYYQLRYCHEGYFGYTKNGRKCWQNFSNRILIPIFDMRGSLACFQGRDITGSAEPKYQFPPQIASAGCFLYDGHNAWGARRLVIGEGAFDVISIRAAFDEDMETRNCAAVGTFGMHLSAGTDGNSQVQKLVELKREGLEEVTFMWDGEKKAISAALEQATILARLGFKVRVAMLPHDKDPNEVPSAVVRQCFHARVDPMSAGGLANVLRRIT